MKIYNVHERAFHADPRTVGSVLDSLSGENDRLWPRDAWPPMKFDKDLAAGAKGGHGPVRYRVAEYTPGRRVVFDFDGTGLTAGLDGRHVFEVIPRNRHVVLRHVVDAECGFKAWAKWHLLIGPLHDALLEDALDRCETAVSGSPGKSAAWSMRVKLLRRIAARQREKREAERLRG
jgi:hypothetical protein